MIKIKRMNKNIILICLIIGVIIISFFLGKKTTIDYHNDEIEKLHNSNVELLKNNDSLKKANDKLDAERAEISKKLENNLKMLNETESTLNNLNNKRNEIPKYVNTLSANGVAKSLSEYLEKRAESTNSN
jgi:peptidoglycan hydrolase CwlO-like protein